ncbi:(deoxy)nucleoside triphosphate pyrophosphohydrolase [Sphingomonas sp. ID1715]|uniref:(deoxy)nucleoside triphosphate pyrophosphohydrolase n=1 Tax=Sphingomonas sp. ID1715 TaxID=1656898 RepID=UPI001487BF6D|nr:(deoxy)nucleoside triphosphate pyrophosphohydrolase [Sphingomonas sp. ID1715]NNM76521.1 (deoxy)nucleoside triphosphate pyrophosphohydrolase [Sphingomonas sp. ID1715]
MPQLLTVVAAALIGPDGHILLQQRPPGKSMNGLWEFPGGKVDPGETPEVALARELEEELGITVAPHALFPAAFASEALGDRHLLLLLFTTTAWTGVPRALEASEVRWVHVDDMHQLPMPPADLPLVLSLSALLRAPQRVGQRG